jgi:hypothetical protein
MAKGKEKKEKRKKLFMEATNPTQITHTERQMIYHFRRGRKRLARGKEKRKKERRKSFSQKLIARER